jgi:hypothetical protein
MTKKLKTFNVVLEYDVQRTYIILAENEEQAEELVLDGKAISHRDHWDYKEVIEVKKVA